MRVPVKYLAVTAAVLGAIAAVIPTAAAAAAGASAAPAIASTATASATTVDTVKVSKAFTNATATTGGEMLIKASSSDRSAHLFAYRPDGTLIGEVQNGGGGRYGGTVMPYQSYDPKRITIRSTSGGTKTVRTTPFQV